MSDSDIPSRSNGQIIDETWFNILKTQHDENEDQITLHGTNLFIPFWLNGSYGYDGARNGLLYYYAKQAITLLSATAWVGTAGASGSTTFDIQRSTDGGSSFASIFTTKPSIPSSAGNFKNSDTGSGATAAVLDSSKVLIADGNILRFDLSAVQGGTPASTPEPKGCALNLIYKVTGALLE